MFERSNSFETVSCFEPDECLEQDSCSVAKNKNSTAQDRINITAKKKIKKNKKNMFTLLTTFL